MLWGFGLSVQMRGKPFPVWGSHNREKMGQKLGSMEKFLGTRKLEGEAML